jgi:hypothetical protein
MVAMWDRENRNVRTKRVEASGNDSRGTGNVVEGQVGSWVQVLFHGGKLKIMTLHTARSDLDTGASHQLLKCHIDHKKNQLEYDLFRKKNTPND